MLHIDTEETLKLHLQEDTKLEYTYDCQNCGKRKQNKSSTANLRFRLEGQGFKVLMTCRSCATRLGKSKRTEESIRAANEKRKQTNLEKYGVENLFKDVDRITAARKDKLGVENVSQLQSVKDKKKQNSLQKFGTEFPTQAVTVKEKIKASNLEKYGATSYLGSQEGKEHIRSVNQEKYGADKFIQSPEGREYIRNLWKDKKKRQELSRKVSNTWKLKSAEDIRQIRSKAVKRFIYQSEQFDSSWELAVWIWAKATGKTIKREPKVIEYEFAGELHTYLPDFEIDGALIEIKGDMFFNSEGKMICPWDESKNEIYEAKHLAALSQGVQFWKLKEVSEALDYVCEKYSPDFLELFAVNIPFPYPVLKGSTDLDLIRYFHKSLFEASKKGKLSPLEAWKDKNLIEKSALNRLKYVHSCTPEDVVKGFSVAQIAPKVSIFKPRIAKELIDKYLKDCSEIFDPFSGFSGRLLGATNCGKNYYGQDINEKHVTESNEIIAYKHLENCKVVQQDILTDSEKTYECLFTCPPYGGKEHWNENNDEIEKSCDDWIKICLQKYKCKKYLFVVDETFEFVNNVVERIKTKTLYGAREELVILI